MTTDPFVPPAADGLPLAALDSATEGANRLDAAARTPTGRNFLAHALVQLARDGWLRAEPGEGFEPVRDREAAEPEEQSAAAPPAPADRGAVLREAATMLDQRATGIDAFSSSDYGEEARAVRELAAAANEFRRMADEAQQAGRPSCPDPIECRHEAALGQAEEKLETVHATATAWARPDMSAPTRVAGAHLLRVLDGDEAQQAGERPEDDEALRAKVDDATSTLRRVRTALRTLKDQGATGFTYYQVIAEALAGPRPDRYEAADRVLAERLAAAKAQPEVFGPEVVAYRHPTKPRAYLCRQHGDGRPGLTPVEADDLEHGGGCDECGGDVLARQTGEAGRG